MVRGRVILMNFLPPGYTQSHLAVLFKNRFHADFGGHVEFVCKMQKHIYLGNGVRWNDFDKIFDPKSHLPLFAENHFPAIFGSHLEILCKMQKRIYLRIGTKLLTPPGCSRVICHLLPKIVFSIFLMALFAGRLNFCITRKTLNRGR